MSAGGILLEMAEMMQGDFWQETLLWLLDTFKHSPKPFGDVKMSSVYSSPENLLPFFASFPGAEDQVSHPFVSGTGWCRRVSEHHDGGQSREPRGRRLES